MTSALDYLTSLGHKEILYIGGEEYINGGKDKVKDYREETYREYMENMGNYNSS